MLIFERDYSGEGLQYLEQDVFDYRNENELPIPTDMHGFLTGTFTVTITWKKDET